MLLQLDGIDRGQVAGMGREVQRGLVDLRLLSERKAAEGAGMGREVQRGLRRT